MADWDRKSRGCRSFTVLCVARLTSVMMLVVVFTVVVFTVVVMMIGREVNVRAK
jgi:hypothetical protein